MRVLEIMGSLHRGGAETMIMNYYRAFDKQLCQMDFVIHARFADDYCVEAENMGAHIIELERPGHIGAIRYIKSLRNAILENGPYEAIHIHTNHQAFLSVIAAKLAGMKKIVVHSHSAVFSKGSVLVNRMVMDLIPVIRIGCGEAAGKALFGFREFEVISNAINIDKFAGGIDKDYKIIKQERFGNKRVVGHIGRFSVQKNHEFIIEIAESMKKQNCNVVFALYGEGELEEEIRKEVIAKGLQDVVIFMGVTNDPVTAYHTFDIFILPSKWEGFPVTLVESQISGVMSLASDRIANECDLKAGLIDFIPLDASAWIKKMKTILEQPDTERKYVASEMTRRFNIDEQWKKLYRIYTA